jgi:ABC-2 type transport system permease protein
MEDQKMSDLHQMLWIELRKVLRSRIPLFTVLASLVMPLGIAFLIYLAKNPTMSQKLGLIGAKANLLAYSTTNWQTYFGLIGQIIAAGGFFLFTFAISWVFGREFVDGTLKDLLAVPVSRLTILLAKFIVLALWSIVIALVILIVSLVMGAIINLPQGSICIFENGMLLMAVTVCLVILTVLPFALFASLGRGYLLPIGIAILALILANLVMVLGLGMYFPWAIPLLFSQGKFALAPVSFMIVVLTGLAGVACTYVWWILADQNR